MTISSPQQKLQVNGVFNLHALIHTATILLALAIVIMPSWRVYLAPVISALGGGGFTSAAMTIRSLNRSVPSNQP